MVNIEVSVDDSQLQELFSAMEAMEAGQFFPNTVKVFGQMAQQTQRVWQGWAMGNSVEGIQNIRKPSGKLAQSIKLESNGAFDYTVSTDSPEMVKIQNGRPEIDMKDLNSPWMKSRKTRVNKKNKPYLIIPFSWTTRKAAVRNVVPMQIVKLLKKRDISTVLLSQDPTKKEPNRYGEMIPRASYQWGGRVSPDESVMENGYDSGMVRMWDSAYDTSVHGKYFTFRVLSVLSPADSWIQKPIEPIDVTGTIARNMQPVIEKNVQEALETDLDFN